jgi:hypothetical protein
VARVRTENHWSLLVADRRQGERGTAA